MSLPEAQHDQIMLLGQRALMNPQWPLAKYTLFVTGDAVPYIHFAGSCRQSGTLFLGCLIT